MKILIIALALLLVAYVVYQVVRITQLVDASRALLDSAQPFERTEGTLSMLVLGDSTAVGVGSNPEGTVAARLAQRMGASVENVALSGARTRDVAAQLSQRTRETYDLVLIQVGANDVIRFSPLESVRTDLEAVLASAQSVSDKVVVLTAGKVGDAPFFPRPLGWIWTARAAAVREHFLAAAAAHDAVYVDLYTAADPFSADPHTYYAPDGLHLAAAGYGFWYSEVEKAIEARWPGFLHD